MSARKRKEAPDLQWVETEATRQHRRLPEYSRPTHRADPPRAVEPRRTRPHDPVVLDITATQISSGRVRVTAGVGEQRQEHVLTRMDAAQDVPIGQPLIGRQITMEYVDASGATTRRTIAVLRVERIVDTVYLSGFCSRAMAPRTFRADRIAHVITEDGELVDPAPYLAGICGTDLIASAVAAHRQQTIVTTPRRPAKADAPAAGVLTLVALGRSDNRLVAAERRVIVDYWLASRPSGPKVLLDEGEIERRITAFRPSGIEISDDIDRLKAASSADRMQFVTAVDQLVAADGRTHGAEQAFKEWVVEQIGNDQAALSSSGSPFVWRSKNLS